jgi:hypothetical protein
LLPVAVPLPNCPLPPVALPLPNCPLSSPALIPVRIETSSCCMSSCMTAFLLLGFRP